MLQTADVADAPGTGLDRFLPDGEQGFEAAPFYLGPFLVNSEGLLRLASDTVVPRFSVLWRGRTMRARIERPDGAAARKAALAVEMVTGRVPSTLSGSGKRAETFALLRMLPSKLPSGWRLHLLPDHHFGVSLETPLAMPISAAELVSRLADFLVCFDPYLVALDATGFGFGGAAGSGAGPAAGTAKT